MKKTILTTAVLSLLSFSSHASCLEMYRDNNLMPDEQDRVTAVILSTTGAVVIAGGLELASITAGVGSAILTSEDGNIFTDLIALDLLSDATSSSTDAMLYGTSSLLAATGLNEGGENYNHEIALLEDSKLSPAITGNTLSSFTDHINDLRSANDGSVTPEEVAEIIREGDESEFFCKNNTFLNTIEIRNEVMSQL